MIPDPRPCPHSCGWEQPDDTTWQRKVDAHLTLRHGMPETDSDSIGELLYLDPVHASDRGAIEWAIRADGHAHGGRVDPNRVRSKIPPWVTPQMIGAVYGAWRRRGLLVPVATTVNHDSKGRNQGKPATVYQLRDEARSSS